MQSLSERRTAVETKFSELQKQQQQTSEEMLRLQGEYRTILDLIKLEDAPMEANEIKTQDTKEKK